MRNNLNKHFPQGKKVYWVGGTRFYNSGVGKNDGRQKAESYCLEQFIDTKDIIVFDSDTEANYYEVLLNKQKNKEISNLSHHYLLLIQDEFRNANGDLIPKITYEADFIYLDLITNKRVVVDVKGNPYFCDGRFEIIKQLFDKNYFDKGIYIQVMCYDKSSKEWYEWHIGDKKKTSGKLLSQYRGKTKSLKQRLNEIEKKQRKEDREKARLNELRDLAFKGLITKAQQKRLDELEARYKV